MPDDEQRHHVAGCDAAAERARDRARRAGPVLGVAPGLDMRDRRARRRSGAQQAKREQEPSQDHVRLCTPKLFWLPPVLKISPMPHVVLVAGDTFSWQR